MPLVLKLASERILPKKFTKNGALTEKRKELQHRFVEQEIKGETSECGI
jgi:hypothetical protein